MLAFDWWWALLLLPLPQLVRVVLTPNTSARLAIAVPLLEQHSNYDSPTLAASSRAGGVYLWAFWICLVLAASRPFWLGEPVTRSVSGRDLMLAVDISGSMNEADMTINSKVASRIDVLKVVVGRFIERRQGDRLGLILFGTNAYTYVPLTFDLEALAALFSDVSTGLAGRHTAIGDAIGLAIKALRKQESRHKVLVLVTDGSNTAGFENPIIAAQAAGQQGLTIYTIGIGTDARTLARVYGQGNIPTGLILNEGLLDKIAEVTGGKYFRATNLVALEQIYLALDKLEPVEYEYQSHRPRFELYQAPLLVGMLTMMLYVIGTLWSSRAVKLT